MPTITGTQSTPKRTLTITQDQIVEVQNIADECKGLLHLTGMLPIIPGRPEEDTLVLEPGEILNFDHYEKEITPQVKLRSRSLRWAIQNGKLLILTVRVKDPITKEDEIVRVASPRSGTKMFDKATQSDLTGAGENPITQKEGFFEGRQEILQLRERREDLETQRGKLLTSEEKAIASGEAEREKAATVRETGKVEIEGATGPANTNVQVVAGKPVVEDGGVSPVRNAQGPEPSTLDAGQVGDPGLDAKPVGAKLRGKNTSVVTPKKR